MMSRMKDMLDDVEIADELQYSFVSTLNATFFDSNGISSMDNGGSKDMTTQEHEYISNIIYLARMSRDLL